MDAIEAGKVAVAAPQGLPGPWLSPRSRSIQASARMEERKRRSYPPLSTSSKQDAATERAPQRRPSRISLGLAPGMGGGITTSLVAETLSELVYLVMHRPPPSSLPDSSPPLLAPSL